MSRSTLTTSTRPRLKPFGSLATLAVLALLGVIACENQISSDLPSANTLPPHYYADVEYGRCCTVIAHAAGAIDGNAYTNSKPALERNYELGTRLFELDFEKTSDGHWVAAHDWPHWKARTGHEGTIPPDLETFNSTPRNYPRVSWSIVGEYSSLDMNEIERFLSSRPDARIVTDMKTLDEFNEFVDYIAKLDRRDQFIFQAYRYEHLSHIQSTLPTAEVILTLYRIGQPPELYPWLMENQNSLLGVTAPMNWAHSEIAMQRLRETGLPIFLHGAPTNINSRSLHQDFAKKGVTGFYLD